MRLARTRGTKPGIQVLLDKGSVRRYPLDKVMDRVIQGDALKVLDKLPAESVDMVFIDPPYFLQLPKKRLRRWNVNSDVDPVDDEWDRFGSFDDYDRFITDLLTKVQRIMKPSATIWVIGTYHSIFRVGKAMQDMGFWILNDVHWVKTNPMPNWLGVRFTNATETLIWALKDRKAKGYKFDKRLAKAVGMGKVGANVWTMPLCTGKERLKGADGGRLHSTQKPSELLKRVIAITTKEGDVVLDPVAGVGTTGHVARGLGRHFIMVEINPKYIDGMRRRFGTVPRIP